MNNRSISWWLGQIGLPQYTRTLEREYYGLEGLMQVTDGDLKEAGIQSQEDRATILYHLRQQQQQDEPAAPGSPTAPPQGRVTRKHSLGSSIDLVGSSGKRLSSHSLGLFRQSVLPRLRRRDKAAFSSCSQLSTLEESLSPGPAPHHGKKDTLQPGQSATLPRKGTQSKRKSVGVYLSNLKLFGGKGGMDTGKDTLKKELEEELKLSTDDLRSHAWYHGQIRREAAESLVEKDGDFLIRDSQSSTGDYVLTCRWKEQPIHFKIIRVVLRPKKGYSRVLFQFEQDQFDNVPALVRFQVGSRKAISDASGAIISRPVNRTLPLRLTGGQQDHSAPQRASTDQLSAWATLPSSTKRLSLNTNPAEMALSNGNLLRNKDKSGSHPASLENLGRRPSMQSSQSDSNLRTGVPQLSQSNGTDCSPPVSPVFRTGSEPLLSPANGHHATLQPGAGPNLRGSDGQLHSRAPPKPLRVSTIFPIPPASWTPDDDPYGEYGELVPRAPILSRGHVDRLRAEEKWQSRARITETSFGFLDSGLSVVFPGGGGDVIAEEDDGPPDGEPHFVRPQVETRSCFRLNLFQSLLLPDNNRPLEPGVLKALKELFTQNDPKTTALHLLHADCQVARITAVTEEQQRLMGVSSGLELITLPHGQQLRKDLLERHHLIALGIAIDILGCTGTVGQRAGVLHKVIQLANELRQTAGDLFAFSAVMKALELPQVHRLEMTWRALRRNHTESAIDFEKKLKPFMKALNEGKAETPLTSIALPHILPLLKVMEGLDLGEHTEQGCELLLCTLGAARTICLNTSQYQTRAQTLLSGWEPIPELLEAFRTEFALRLFWGQKGAEVAQKERYEKFDRILDVLSNKLEPAEALAS